MDKCIIILQDKVFVSEYNSYADMLEELNIEDSYENKENVFIKAKLMPENEDVFSDIDTWIFNIEQNVLPYWYQEEIYKANAIKALKIWAKEHIHIGKEDIKIHSGTHYLKDCEYAEVYGKTFIFSYGNSIIGLHDNSMVLSRDNSIIFAYDKSTALSMDKSTVHAWNNSKVHAYNNSKISAWDNSKVLAEENTVIDANHNSIIFSLNGSKVESFDNSTIIDFGDYAVESFGSSKVYYNDIHVLIIY